MDLYGVFGVGGFGREVMPLVRWQLRGADARAVFIVDGVQAPAEVHGLPVLTLAEFLAQPEAAKYFTVAVGDGAARRMIAGKLLSGGARPFSVTAPSHRALGGNACGPGAIWCDHSVVTADARIGAFFHANLFAYVAHDCVIGDFVTFAPRVSCNGWVTVEDGVTIGTGALIRNGSQSKRLVIGRDAVIGMGAVVTKSVPAGVTVVGNPARVLQRVETMP